MTTLRGDSGDDGVWDHRANCRQQHRSGKCRYLDRPPQAAGSRSVGSSLRTLLTRVLMA
jgi:hypothetical protein